MTPQDNIIKIESFNPYRHLFPNRKLISRDTLDLIKILRQNGKQIVILPDNNRPVEYIFTKGISDYFKDPLVVYLIGIPTTIIVGLLTNAVDRILAKRKKEKDNSTINIFINTGYNNQIINIQGEKVSSIKVSDVKQKVIDEAKNFQNCYETNSPYKNLPSPIFLEHQPKIVGWCKLKITDFGLVAEDAIITDSQTMELMKNGTYQGASIAGIAKKSTCSVCKKSYVECEHLTGQTYNGVECVNSIESADILDVSLVKTAINQKCFFEIKNKTN